MPQTIRRIASLAPGDRVSCANKTMVFVRRVDGRCFFRCEAYAGQYGPDDGGICSLAVSDVKRLCVLEGREPMHTKKGGTG